MSVVIRPGTADDSFAAHEVFVESVLDLGARLNVNTITGGNVPDLWERRRPLFDHLARTADAWWVADDGGRLVGYARALLRDGVRQLADFFVRPGNQAAGVGRELLARAFSPDGARRRVVIATLDTRAQARYMKSGVFPRFPVGYLARQAEPAPLDPDLEARPLILSPETGAILNRIDAEIIGFTRPVDHAWLAVQRRGFLYFRAGQPAGYGYVGYSSGPFAALDSGDLPAILAHAESDAAAHGQQFGVETPLVNEVALRYLLARGFELDTFFEFFMTDGPLGSYERYLFTSPPFFT